MSMANGYAANPYGRRGGSNPPIQPSPQPITFNSVNTSGAYNANYIKQMASYAYSSGALKDWERELLDDSYDDPKTCEAAMAKIRPKSMPLTELKRFVIELLLQIEKREEVVAEGKGKLANRPRDPRDTVNPKRRR